MSRRNWRALLVALCVMTLALGIFSGCGTSQTSLDVIQLDSGKISGTQQGSTRTFLGIPYAKPPVGNLRWKPPEAAGPVERHSRLREVRRHLPPTPGPGIVRPAE